VNTVGLVLQNPGAEPTELILNALFFGVFHFLTSLRSREAGGDFLPFNWVIRKSQFWQPISEKLQKA